MHRSWAVFLTGAVLAAACSNSEEPGGSETPAVDAPGVTDSEIRVGGVASTTNPLEAKFDDAFDGVDAYFQMVNEDGGIHGRELSLVARHDDQLANNDAAVQELLTQDDVFAVLPVNSILFTGADRLVAEGVPTFGITIDTEWEGTEEEPKENLFGQNGSFLCFDCATPMPAFLADEIGATKVGILAYNIPSSTDCATGHERSFERYAEPGSAAVAFTDYSLTFGIVDLSVQVARMKDADVDFVIACMDLQGVVTLAREMKRQSLDAVQYLLNGYDHELLSEFGDLFQGSYVLTFFTPFEVEDPPEGLQSYLDWMDRTGGEPNENSLNGWLDAALFVEGLRQAGPEFSRQSVIDAINEMTDWDADGLLPGVDWTIAHTQDPATTCEALSLVDGEEFVPSFGEPGRPFVCLDDSVTGIPDAVLSE